MVWCKFLVQVEVFRIKKLKFLYATSTHENLLLILILIIYLTQCIDFSDIVKILFSFLVVNVYFIFNCDIFEAHMFKHWNSLIYDLYVLVVNAKIKELVRIFDTVLNFFLLV